MEKQIEAVKLNEDEIKILDMLSDGEYPRTIAPIFKLSHRTIESKIAVLKIKFNTKNVTHLVVKYLKQKKC